MIKKSYVFFLSVLVIHFLFVFATGKHIYKVDTALNGTGISNEVIVNNPKDVYDSINLAALGLSRQAYDYAMKGFNYLLSSGKIKNSNIISIVDFSLASSKKRLFVIDLKNYKVLFNTFVSHGRNSGREIASSFSNEPESFKSSPGFYITLDTYNGKHGHSLRLNGTEKGINDKALERAIVMHGASYVDENLIRTQGYIGRSLGCPAVPEQLHRQIIEEIKGGTCLFLYSPDKSYLAKSSILNHSVA